tara:strand:+ start:227 stop:400 length:174 start_codon:yes stop_codon:yes gene_type:complete
MWLEHKKLREDVERLIAAVQQELEWDETDIKTYDMIQAGMIDWSGEVNSKFKKWKVK